MQPTKPRTNLSALSHTEMANFVQGLGWPRYRTIQILKWLYQQRVTEIGAMTTLSKNDRVRLEQVATVERGASHPPRVSVDGTQKFLGILGDGEVIETILIPEGRRTTLCVSSQVGCTLDCGFCLTAQIGIKRNLAAYEIVNQVLQAQATLPKNRPLTSLVFMGMGEPLINFEAVAEAIHRLTNLEWGLGYSPRRITVSTAGWIPRLPDIRCLGVNLAISLNATTNDQRQQLMPAVNGRYPLDRLLEACRDYSSFSERPLTFEYVLLAGINDSPEDAKRLASLLRGIRCKINLIPFNEFQGNSFQRPSQERIDTFQRIVRNKGYDVLLRKIRGDDVLGACGQLGQSTATRLSPDPTKPKRNLQSYASS